MAFGYSQNPFTSQGQWKQIASGIQQSPKNAKSIFRASYKPNPNTSRSQWNDMVPGFREAFEESQKNKPMVKVQSPQSGGVDMSAYQPQQHPARQRYYASSPPPAASDGSKGVDISGYRPGQSQPKAPVGGDSYGQWIGTDDQIRLTDWRDTDGDKIDDRWQPGPGQPSMQRRPAPSRADEGYVFPEVQPAKNTQPSAARRAVQVSRPAVLPAEIKKPTFQVARAPDVFGVPPQLPQAGFSAQYTDLQGNVSEQPGYAQRDAFIDLINQSLLPYQTGMLSGPPRYDISSMLNQAREMSSGGYQNPFDLRGNGFGINPLAGLFG